MILADDKVVNNVEPSNKGTYNVPPVPLGLGETPKNAEASKLEYVNLESPILKEPLCGVLLALIAAVVFIYY